MIALLKIFWGFYCLSEGIKHSKREFVKFISSVTNCIIEDKILIDAKLISQIMDRPTMYIDTSMLIDWVKFELHIGKLKPDIRDLAKHNLNILKSRYVGKYDVIVPQMVVGEFCMVILEYYSGNLNPTMSWLSNFICKYRLDVKPIPKDKAYSIIETAKEILSCEVSSGDYGERQLDFTDSLILSQALHDFDSKILLTTDGRMQEAVYIHEIEEKIDRPHNLKIIDDLNKV